MEQKAWIAVRSAAASYTVPGTVERAGNGFLLRFDEPASLGMGTVTTELSVADDRAELRRSGEVRCWMRFAPGEAHAFPYETPFGTFPAELHTRSLRAREGADRLLVDLRYALSLGGGAPEEHHMKLLARWDAGA